MLQAFEAIYDTHYEINYERVALTMQQIALNMDFQKKVKSLFS
jgi:hypothetical protein